LEKEVLDEFEKRFQRLMLHFTRYNTIDNNVIERVILSDEQVERMADHDKILVVGGKINDDTQPITGRYHGKK
jgi:phosphate starvation-inducible PhoH-like protein